MCRENVPLIKMSKKFVMISAPNGEEPQDDTFRIGMVYHFYVIVIDGSYFPRFYFINPDGSVNYDIISDPDAEKYQFFYPEPERIVSSMKQMIKDLKAKKQRKKARMEKMKEEIAVEDESVYEETDL